MGHAILQVSNLQKVLVTYLFVRVISSDYLAYNKNTHSSMGAYFL